MGPGRLPDSDVGSMLARGRALKVSFFLCNFFRLHHYTNMIMQLSSCHQLLSWKKNGIYLLDFQNND